MQRHTGRQAPTDHRDTRALVHSAFSLARTLGITSLVVQADEISDLHLVAQLRDGERVIWVTRHRQPLPLTDPAHDVVLPIPEVFLNRLHQFHFAVFLATLNRHLSPHEKVLGLTGVAGSQRLDTLFIATPARDFPWLQEAQTKGDAQGRTSMRTGMDLRADVSRAI